jgi:hypothetical protein
MGGGLVGGRCIGGDCVNAEGHFFGQNRDDDFRRGRFRRFGAGYYWGYGGCWPYDYDYPLWWTCGCY